MPRHRPALGLASAAAIWCAAVALATPAPASVAAAAATPSDDGAGLVSGRVVGPAASVPDARVYAFQVADLSLARVVTDGEGRFAFEGLPAGLYKIIAHKAGFLPVVVMLTRASAEARQFLELQLLDAPGGAAPTSGDFWSVREQIPSDVLRDLEIADAPLLSVVEPMTHPARVAQSARFQTEMGAMTGVDQVTQSAEGYVTTGRLGLRGKLGPVKVGVSGDFWQLDSAPFSSDGRGDVAAGAASALQVRVENADQEQFHLTSLSNRMTPQFGAPIELEHFRVSLSQRIGQVGRSNFLAQYTNESNFYREGWFNAVGLPDASRRPGASRAPTPGRSAIAPRWRPACATASATAPSRAPRASCPASSSPSPRRRSGCSAAAPTRRIRRC